MLGYSDDRHWALMVVDDRRSDIYTQNPGHTLKTITDSTKAKRGERCRASPPLSKIRKSGNRPPPVRLRMVHQYIPLNSVTVKMSYPMKRIEPILNMVGQSKWKVFFKADAANGYWLLSLLLEPFVASQTLELAACDLQMKSRSKWF